MNYLTFAAWLFRSRRGRALEAAIFELRVCGRAYTVKYTRTKAEKVVVTGTRIRSPDGKTLTFTSTGTNV